jgi:hypothetical protein
MPLTDRQKKEFLDRGFSRRSFARLATLVTASTCRFESSLARISCGRCRGAVKIVPMRIRSVCRAAAPSEHREGGGRYVSAGEFERDGKLGRRPVRSSIPDRAWLCTGRSGLLALRPLVITPIGGGNAVSSGRRSSRPLAKAMPTM